MNSTIPFSLARAFALTASLAALVTGCDAPSPSPEAAELRFYGGCGSLCGGMGNSPIFVGTPEFFEFDLAGSEHLNSEGHTIAYLGGDHPTWGSLPPGQLGVDAEGTLNPVFNADPLDGEGLELSFLIDGELRVLELTEVVETHAGLAYLIEEKLRGGASEPLCEPDQFGNSHAFLYRDFRLFTQQSPWVAAGELIPAPGAVHIACSAGATGKASSWGFRPQSGDALSESAFEAALRAVRLDFCGDGSTHTTVGATVALNDATGALGGANDEVDDMVLEAAFDQDGVVCWEGVLRDGASAPDCENLLDIPLCSEYLEEHGGYSDELPVIETYIPQG